MTYKNFEKKTVVLFIKEGGTLRGGTNPPPLTDNLTLSSLHLDIIVYLIGVNQTRKEKLSHGK